MRWPYTLAHTEHLQWVIQKKKEEEEEGENIVLGGSAGLGQEQGVDII